MVEIDGPEPAASVEPILEDDPRVVRTKTRDGRPVTDESSNVGFRCAKSL